MKKIALITLLVASFGCCTINNTKIRKVNVFVDSIEYHGIQTDNIAQTNPYSRAHLIRENVWISTSVIDTSKVYSFDAQDTTYLVTFILKHDSLHKSIRRCISR